MKKSFSSPLLRISAVFGVMLVFLAGLFQFGVVPGNFGLIMCNGRPMTAAQVAAFRGISSDMPRLLQTQRGLSLSEVCNMPQSSLDRAVNRALHPNPDHPGDAVTFRRLQLQDENGFIPEDGLVKAAAQIKTMLAAQNAKPQPDPDNAGIATGSWTWLGPGNVGGRVRSIVIHPTTTSTMWAGSVAGGIWKSTDSGASWQIQTDFLANMAVATLVMDPLNANTLYAGTGEGFYNADGIQGAGVFKTIDGGTTWNQLAATNTSNWYYVNRLAISPDGATLLAATSSGIWRSTDGGTTWSQRSTARTLDINFNPSDSSKAVASGSASSAWYSIDQGLTWTAATGLPASSSYLGRVELAYAPSSPATVYASIDVNSGEIWKSADGGASYSIVSTGYSYLGSQGWYDNIIWVDPTNPNILMVGGIDIWRSTNAGANLTKVSQWWSAPLSAHADNHMIIQDPGFNGTTNKKVYFGNDGGVYRANDVYTVSAVTGWTELNNNLGITQFYGAAGNPSSGKIVGGTQDNGSLLYTSAGGTEGWGTTFGGDGGFSASDPTDPNYFYGEYVYLQLHRSTDAGVSANYIYTGITDAGSCANFISPFILDPNNPNTLLGGGCSLWRSTNVKAAAPSWSAIKSSTGSNISAIAVAPGNSNIVWVGQNNGNVYKTINGAAASPTWTQMDNNATALPNRYVMRITIDKNDNNKVYVTFGGFNTDNVWASSNGGSSWAAINSGLPALPVRSLVINPNNSNWLYIGTELGIFTSQDGGSTWKVPQDGPTNTSVDELFWMNTTLVAATHGRGMFKAETNSCFTLTLNVSPLAGGSIGPNPAPNCVAGSGYASGTVVTLTANAGTGYAFSAWSGDVVSVANPVQVTVSANKSVTATFTPITYSITGTTGTAGATVTYTGGVATANGSGGYTITVPYGWTGVVTPSKAGTIFTPANRSYASTPVTGNLTGQDFTPTPYLHVVDDFNGDGKTDLAVFRKPTGFWYIHYQDGTSSSKQWGNAFSGDVPVPGDYNGDGLTDYAVWRQSTGTWFVKYADDTTYSQQWGNYSVGDIPVPGDYNGDGKTDLAVWRPSNGTWYVHFMDGTSTSQQWGNSAAGDVPVPGDYNGDGKTEFAVFRKSTGYWYIRYANGTSQARQWGNAANGDIPVPGDYNGDGLTELAVWRPTTGYWFIKYADDTNSSLQWGNYPSGDMPVSGDFNGDGKTDYAVWRPSNGTWYVKYADGTTYSQQWGNLAAGDSPLPPR